MSATDFISSSITISVWERSFLTQDHFKQLLSAKDDEAVSLVFQGTPYKFTKDTLKEPNLIEKELMRVLKNEYDKVIEQLDDATIVEILSSKYLFHNLKLFLKQRATGRDLSELAIPIGVYSVDTAKYLGETLESSVIATSVVEDIKSAWKEYEHYKLIDTLNVSVDEAYYNYLRFLENIISNKEVTDLVSTMVDFYNVISIKRALDLNKSRAFMMTVTSRESSIDVPLLIEMVQNNQLAKWFENQTDVHFGITFEKYVNKMNDGTITAQELEDLRDQYIHQYLYESRLESSSPLSVIRYLFGKEMEVKNLRLILMGRVNEISTDRIEERMQPIYGKSV